MFDLQFHIKANALRKDILSGAAIPDSWHNLYGTMEDYRSKTPYVFNIETTNVCNMTCRMCPRTTLMTRKTGIIEDSDFKSLLDQIKPHDNQDFQLFKNFICDEYGIKENDRSEDAFYFYRISRCLTLHGYGEPLLDPHIVSRVQQCSERNIPSYFSCVPANVTLEMMKHLMEEGLSVIKFSLDELSDEGQRAVRGHRNNYTESIEKILSIISYKKLNPQIDTEIVITMLSFSEESKEMEKQKAFIDLWHDHPVYAYIKSQDNRWYYKYSGNYRNRSHYERQYCEFPWTSLSVMSNGTVVPCTQDYNAEMKMGSVKEDRIYDIWNGPEYARLRHYHITGCFPEGFKCSDRCDLPKLYQRLIT